MWAGRLAGQHSAVVFHRGPHRGSLAQPPLPLLPPPPPPLRSPSTSESGWGDSWHLPAMHAMPEVHRGEKPETFETQHTPPRRGEVEIEGNRGMGGGWGRQ